MKDKPSPHTKLVPRVKVGKKSAAQIDREKVEALGPCPHQPIGTPIEFCPPGEAEPPDPGWEAHKPRERAGFRELDEYADDADNDESV